MAYRKVYFRIRTDCYSSGWTSDADRTAFKEESRRLFQELGWAVTFGHNGSCDTAAKDQQDLYLHPNCSRRAGWSLPRRPTAMASEPPPIRNVASPVSPRRRSMGRLPWRIRKTRPLKRKRGENRCQPQKISAHKSAWNCIKKSRRPERNRA